MLFEVIIGAITLIIEIIAKLILFLLKVLGLWIPALYTILFIIFCAIFQISFTEVLAIYFVGLAISMILAFYIMFLRVMHRRKRRFMQKQKKRAKGKDRKKDSVEDESDEKEKKPKRSFFARKEKKEEDVEQTATQTQETKPVNEGYQPYLNPANPQKEGEVKMENYQPPQTNPIPPQYVSPQEPDMTSTKPLIFRTRTDPNILIYEYSDRLVYYKKTLNGLEHIKTERKG